MSGKYTKWTDVENRKLILLAKQHEHNWGAIAMAWNNDLIPGSPHKTAEQLRIQFKSKTTRAHKESGITQTPQQTPQQTTYNVFHGSHNMQVISSQVYGVNPFSGSIPQTLRESSSSVHPDNDQRRDYSPQLEPSSPPYYRKSPPYGKRLEDEFDDAADDLPGPQNIENLSIQELRKKAREDRGTLPQEVALHPKDDEETQKDRIWVRDCITSLDDHPDIWSMKGLRDARNMMFDMIIEPLQMTGKIDTRSLLLYGPPGTGKTSFAMSLAATLRGNFWMISGGSLASSYKGKSLRLIKALFEEAAETAEPDSPSIILLDECHSLFSANPNSDSSNLDAVEYLTSMQNMLTKAPFVVLIGTTNFPWQIDNRFLRRFKAWIHIPLPDQEEVEEQIKDHIAKSNFLTKWQDINIGEVAAYMMKKRYSYADIHTVLEQVIFLEKRKQMKDKGILDVNVRRARMMDRINQGLEAEVVTINTAAINDAITQFTPRITQEEVERLAQWQSTNSM